MPHVAVDTREGISDTEIGSECSSSINESKNQERRKEKGEKNVDVRHLVKSMLRVHKIGSTDFCMREIQI